MFGLAAVGGELQILRMGMNGAAILAKPISLTEFTRGARRWVGRSETPYRPRVSGSAGRILREEIIMRNWRRTVKAMLMALGSGVFVLTGCDPTVRDTVLGGVEGAASSLSTTFIQAFFESLAKDPNSSTL